MYSPQQLRHSLWPRITITTKHWAKHRYPQFTNIDDNNRAMMSVFWHTAWDFGLKEMNQDGALNPKASSDSGRHSGSPHEESIANHEQTQHTLGDDRKYTSKRNTPNLLATCARSDKGGGVGLNHEVFAIYSTATLPPLWTDTLHSSAGGDELSNTIERLRVLADSIAESLPIYTSWHDIAHSPPEHASLKIHSLNTSPSSTTTHPAHNLIHREIPHFLLNASLHKSHCIIGQRSKIETLLVILRRPWCVLEICVSNAHDVEVLEAIRMFARVAQEVDAAGYGTAVFLLGVEIDARQGHHLQRCRTVTTDYRWKDGYLHKRTMLSSRVYELCNATVFIPSLRSFNSFWIRLICVCAIELEVSFSCIICMLCDQRQMPEDNKQEVRHFESDITFAAGIDMVQYAGRRHSTSELSSSRFTAEGHDGNIVQRMLDLYRHVLRRTENYI